MSPDLDPATVVVHAGRPPRVPDAPLGESPVFSSTYVAGGSRGYGRFGNDAWTAFEETLGRLESGPALSFASAGPVLQQPLALGAAIVMHPATKSTAGPSAVALGAVVTAEVATYDAVELRRRSLGAIPGPMEAWLALRGMRTLALRLERAQQN